MSAQRYENATLPRRALYLTTLSQARIEAVS
jgi:hypothetical protein